MDINRIVASFLEEVASKIRNNECEMDADEAIELLSQIAHIKMNKHEVAELFEVSEKTIERKEQTGEFPQSYNQQITKKIWYLDELIKYKNSLEKN